MLKQDDSFGKILFLGFGKIFVSLFFQLIILLGLLYGVTCIINVLFGITLSLMQVVWYYLMGLCLFFLGSFTLTMTVASIGYVINLFMYKSNLLDFSTNDNSKK
jgi:hypothetical protein